MAAFRLKILTPSGQPLDAPVISLVAPGEDGYLGIMAHHAPLITTLVPGKLKVTFEDKVERYYTISGGLLKVYRNEALLLTESVEETEG